MVAVDVARLSMVVVCVHLRQRLIALWAAVNIAESAVCFERVLINSGWDQEYLLDDHLLPPLVVTAYNYISEAHGITLVISLYFTSL